LPPPASDSLRYPRKTERESLLPGERSATSRREILGSCVGQATLARERTRVPALATRQAPRSPRFGRTCIHPKDRVGAMRTQQTCAQSAESRTGLRPRQTLRDHYGRRSGLGLGHVRRIDPAPPVGDVDVPAEFSGGASRASAHPGPRPLAWPRSQGRFVRAASYVASANRSVCARRR
jgi:hypothetical protein